MQDVGHDPQVETVALDHCSLRGSAYNFIYHFQD